MTMGSMGVHGSGVYVIHGVDGNGTMGVHGNATMGVHDYGVYRGPW